MARRIPDEQLANTEPARAFFSIAQLDIVGSSAYPK